MKPRIRFIVILIAVIIIAGFCGARLRAEERAKPRSDKSQAQSERRRGGAPEARQPRQRERQPEAQRTPQRSRTGDGDRAQNDDARRRHPQPRTEGRRDNDDRRRDADRDRSQYNYRGRSDAQRRHPRPDGRYERRYPQWDRYHWRNWQYRDRWHRDRFPRLYIGIRLFDGFLYRGRPFGPHYGLPYLRGRTWRMCYWPFPYPPSYGCGYYYVPTERIEYYDPYTGERYYEYTNYEYIYLCID